MIGEFLTSLPTATPPGAVTVWLAEPRLFGGSIKSNSRSRTGCKQTRTLSASSAATWLRALSRPFTSPSALDLVILNSPLIFPVTSSDRSERSAPPEPRRSSLRYDRRPRTGAPLCRRSCQHRAQPASSSEKQRPFRRGWRFSGCGYAWPEVGELTEALFVIFSREILPAAAAACSAQTAVGTAALVASSLGQTPVTMAQTPPATQVAIGASKATTSRADFLFFNKTQSFRICGSRRPNFLALTAIYESCKNAITHLRRRSTPQMPPPCGVR